MLSRGLGNLTQRSTSRIYTHVAPEIPFKHGGSRLGSTIVPSSVSKYFGRRSRLYASSALVLGKDYPPHEVFPMPALSPTMESGIIGSWALAEGDAFEAGQVLCSIETDKASVDFEAQDEGVLAKILEPAGPAEILCGEPICVAVDDPQHVAAFSDFAVEVDVQSKAIVASLELTESPTVNENSNPSMPPSLLFPSARHLAESNGLNATVLQGSGKGGRVTKGDVILAMKSGLLPPLSVSAPDHENEKDIVLSMASEDEKPVLGDLAQLQIQSDGGYEDIPNNKMRKIIASRLSESKATVPHLYVSTQIPLDAILQLRKKLAKDDVKVSVNDFIIRCSALALRDVPSVNNTFDSVSRSIKQNHSIDVSVAVATPTGLITPIVFDTDSLGLSEITATVRDLATRARDGSLAPHEYQGGTFSVSNLGMFGIDEFSAVINPPQAAILAVGAGTPSITPAPYNPDVDSNTSPQLQTLMTARLSFDRRVVNESTASMFMSTLSKYMTEPSLLLL